MPVLTCIVENLGGTSSTEKIEIYVEAPRASTADPTTLIVGPPIVVRPVAGVYTTPNLDPGPAVFAYGKTVKRFTIPDEAGPVQLVPLLMVPFVPPPPPTWQTVADATYAPLVGGGVATVTTPTDAAIRVALAALGSAGGVINLPAGEITLTSPLPRRSGVLYQGVPPVAKPSNNATPAYLGDMEPVFTGGTILKGNGTFACFEANPTDQGSSPATPGADQITGGGVRDVAIDGFTYGIHSGAKNIMGDVYAIYDNVMIKNCTAWGVKLVNFQHCEIDRIKTWICQNGQFYGNDMPLSVLMCGNSTINEPFNLVPRDGRDQRLCRGIVFDAGAGDGVLNELFVNRIQVNQFKSSLLSVAATFTNGSPNIGVPNGALFAVGMPVTFTTSANGFTAFKTYLVRTVAGNVITLKNSVTEGAINATGTTAMTVQSWGFPNLEITRQGGTASVKHSKFSHVDVEGAATAAIYIDGAGQLDITLAEHPATREHDFVIRKSAFVILRSADAARTDFDNDGGSCQFWGQRDRRIGLEGTGIWFNNQTGAREMSLSGYSGGPELTSGDGGIWVGRFAENSKPAGFSTNMDPGWLGHANWGESSPRTMTIVDPSTARIGDWHQVNNVGTNTVTVNTASGSSQGFNKTASLRSIAVPTKSWARFVCVATDDGTPFWLVTKGALASA